MVERTMAYGKGYAQEMTDAYARAGVNIDAGNETVERYREVTSAIAYTRQTTS